MSEARPPSLATYAAIAAVALVAGFGAIYVTFRSGDNARPLPAVASPVSPPSAVRPEPAPKEAPSKTAVSEAGESARPAGIHPLSQGEMAAFVFKRAPEPLAEIRFTDASGAERTLADWKGRVVLLNLWATWCGPCRKEMPGLERLQAELGSDRFEVVALAVDRTGIDGAKRFLNQIKVSTLGLYADAAVRAGSALKAIGMPTTLLIDAEGREIGRLVGPAEWDSEDAKRLVRAHLEKPSR
jgi:thiol-disulfide isomerase/thioredoxin